MGAREILMPDVGEGITEAEIAEWHVKPGDPVREDDILAAVTTDKATIEIPSPVDGTVVSLTGEIGEIIAVGSVIITLSTGGGAEVPQEKVKKPEPARSPEASPQKPDQPEPVGVREAPADAAVPVDATAPVAGRRPLAAPAVRRRALDAGIDLSDVPGSGPAGRISHADLDAWVENPRAAGAQHRARTVRTDIEEIKIAGVRRKIAERMQQANARVAHITYVEELDVTDLENLRAHLNKNKAEERRRLTVLPFLMLAMVRALEDHPKLNAHFDDEAGILRQHGGIHIGMAAQTPSGLMVPVIAHAETRDLWDLAEEAARLGDAARSGKIGRDDLTGSTITLSSLGPLGGIVSTPIINLPEVAIIGVNKIVMRQVWRDGGFVPRKIMNLSSSFDHRVIDGWDAAVFIQDIKNLIENPATLFMER